MSLQVDYQEGVEPIANAQGTADWLLPPRPLFAGSSADPVLRLEIERYSKQLVGGRSFLIAGHRGAGKTTFVARVVDEVNRSSFKGKVDLDFPQRPILVPVHGPGLVQGGAWGQVEAKDALQRIAEALYRALSAEAAQCFRQHAAAMSNRHGHSDALEVAAALALDLDGGPDAALLRQRYAQLGRLGEGVFWPTRLVSQFRRRDQGLREILALATAAQVYRVCTGAVRYAVEELRGAKDEAELSARWARQPTGRQLAGTTVGGVGGALAGYAAFSSQAGVLLPVVVGLGTAVLARLATTFSLTRSRSAGASAKHEFIRDTSLGSLERDLPRVIDRIREAGLAPVFVVDELDKVKDVKKHLQELINKTKHIVVDRTLFCFLANRDYFDYIHDETTRNSFPVEHTYFSHRLLLCAESEPLYDHLLEVIKLRADGPSPTSKGGGMVEQAMARHAAVAYCVHRSHHHHFDLYRELANLVDNDGSINDPIWLLSRTNLLHVLIAYKIREILERPSIREQMRSTPGIGQRLIDACHYISRAWLSGKTEVLVSPQDLASYLAERAGNENLQYGWESKEILYPCVQEIREMLREPRPFANVLARKDGLDPQERQLREILAMWAHEPVLVDGAGPEDVFAITAGGLRFEHRAQAFDRPTDYNRAKKIIDAVKGVLDAYEIKEATLAQESFLPPTPTWQEIADLRERVERDPRIESSRFEADELHAFANLLVRQSGALAALLDAAVQVAYTHPSDLINRWPKDRIERCAKAILRYVDLRGGSSALDKVAGLKAKKVHATLASEDSEAWANTIIKRKPKIEYSTGKDASTMAGTRWSEWRKALLEPGFLRGSLRLSASRDDLVLAAMGEWPSAFLRRDMDRIGPVGWARLAIAGHVGGYRPLWPGCGAPDWALLPALAALGAGEKLLQAALGRVKQSLGGDDCGQLLAAAGADRRVFVLEVPEGTPDDAPIRLPESLNGVLLAVPSEASDTEERGKLRLDSIAGLIEWIRAQGSPVLRLKGLETWS